MLESLDWEALEDDQDNLYFEANSPYIDDDLHFKWRIRQKLTRNRIVWVADHCRELGGDYDGIEWETLAEAQQAILVDHNRILDHEAEYGHSERGLDDEQLSKIR